MGVGEIVDGLTRRVGLFERCYLVDYVSLLAGMQCYADHIMEKRFDVLDEESCRQDMASSLAVIGEHFSRLPSELEVVEPCSAHLSVLSEFWEKYYDENWHFFEEGRYSQGRMYSSEVTLIYACESLLRCINLNPHVAGVIDKIRTSFPEMHSAREFIAESPEMTSGLKGKLRGLLGEMDKCLETLASMVSCDEDFAPLVVSGFMLQELSYWTGEFLAGYSQESFCNVRGLSLSMSQLGSLFKRNYTKTLDVLHKIPGYESFETGARDVEGNMIVSKRLGENLEEDG